jgi:GGDEF domain-containing protein
MARSTDQSVLLIGAADRQLHSALAGAIPGASVRHVPNIFDGIAELSHERYGAVLVAAEPISRRPEAAVRTLRDLAGDSRVILYGDAGLEPLNRRMLNFGCDDYLVTPVTAAQIEEALTDSSSAAAPAPVESPMRLHTDYDDPRMARIAPPSAPTPVMRSVEAAPAPTEPQRAPSLLSGNALSDIALEALLNHPGDAITYAVDQINARLAATGPARLTYIASTTSSPTPAPNDRAPLTFTIQSNNAPSALLHLHMPAAQESLGSALLNEVGPMLTKISAIQRRQQRLQKLAFTDDLTGLFNSRYFKNFLGRTLAEARKNRFPVTLFLFDIDNFKSYNDRFGHACGDDILKQTSNLMRRCVRDHDLVARIGGDEFAVVFWEKEGPRTPRDFNPGTAGRPPSEPEQILARFRKLLEAHTFPLLGPTGRGTLTISGGLAVYPYDAADIESLIDAADKALMFGAKRSGRNSIHLVGGGKAGEAGG